MRIAVSGTHSVGKSTFVWDFIKAHPEYVREEEPYRVLRDNYNIKFGKQSTRFCNGLQMYQNISRIKQYPNSESKVIFDRSPIDYIAYSLYTANYHQTDLDQNFVDSLITPVKESLEFIDLLIFISINKHHPVEIEDDGIRPIDKSYRSEVDEFFKKIYFENQYNLLSVKNPPKLFELWGSREERIRKITELLK
ncbi:MAG: AAA family ATPase [Legionella longbeachae]|nr:AAA family ATPase [Legionella longbeachae]